MKLPHCAWTFCPLLLSALANAEQSSFADALTKGEIKALLRYSGQHRDTTLQVLQDSSEPDVPGKDKKQYSAVGGFFGYRTASWFGNSLAATVYTSQPFGSNPSSRRGLGGLYEADQRQESYAVFGEAYYQYENDSHQFRMGRQEIPHYRYVSLSDIRMTPITHEAITYENRTFEGLQIHLAYVTQLKERNDDSFINMAKAARLQEFNFGKPLIRGDYDPQDYDDSGYIGDDKAMALVGINYESSGLILEAWAYQVQDFLNIGYLYSEFTLHSADNRTSYSLAAQYSYQQDTGDSIAGNIDTWQSGFSVRASGDGWGAFASYNEVDYNEASYDGGTLFVRWGTPQAFNSFQVQDSELAGTRSWGLGYQFDLGMAGILPGVVLRWRYGDYDLPDALSDTDARQDRTELTFDLRYAFDHQSGFGIFTPLEGWSAQFRLAYNDYDTGFDFEAYREIHGYAFDAVTDDFWDWRLYIEYRY